MNKLTAEKCRHHIDRLSDGGEQRCLSIYEEDYLQALEIALAVLEQEDDYFGALVLKARESAVKAMAKFPQPNYVLLKVAEEAGEVVQAGVHYAEKRMTWEELEGEVVQLMAMLFRLVTEGDQVNGITPPQPQPPTTPKIDNDVWIEWNGGERPVSYHTPVFIRYFDGEESEVFAGHIPWEHCGDGDDIIAYRVIDNDGREG